MLISIDSQGIAEAQRVLSKERLDRALTAWFTTGSAQVRDALRARAPARLKARVKVKLDGQTPPRFARIRAYSPLTHLLEGGTGRLGIAPFTHAARHWPSTAGIAEATGLPQPEAFLVARAIGLRGGNPPRPFVQPTYDAVHMQIEQLAEKLVAEAFS